MTARGARPIAPQTHLGSDLAKRDPEGQHEPDRARQPGACPPATLLLPRESALEGDYEPDQNEKGRHLVRAVRRSGAEGVIFAAPSFCDPALLDRPMLQHVLKDAGIPNIAFKYAENSGQMQPIREQAGTFADSIKLWSEA